MKKTAFLFLAALQLAAEVGAEERVIPFDDLIISVDIPGPPQPENGKLRVNVSARRLSDAPEIRGGTMVTCPELAPRNTSLEREEVAALMAACAAATSGQEYRQECPIRAIKTVFEVVTLKEGRRVRMQRDGEAFFAPQKGAWLKETLAQAAAAEAWYKLLLTETQMPVKTAAAHPPQVTGYDLISKVGEVCGDIRKEGLCYEATVNHFNIDQKRQHEVWHGLQFHYYGEHRGTTTNYGAHMGITDRGWVKPMMDQVALALEAVEKQQAFTFESPPGAMGAFGATNDTNHKFTVTANLATQQADVRFIPGYPIGFFGGTHAGGSFGMAQLAAIRELNARVDAREKWFTEHEAWFFERQEGM